MKAWQGLRKRKMEGGREEVESKSNGIWGESGGRQGKRKGEHERAIGPGKDVPEAPFADFGFVGLARCHGFLDQSCFVLWA